jgi:hypothetical protein
MLGVRLGVGTTFADADMIDLRLDGEELPNKHRKVDGVK